MSFDGIDRVECLLTKIQYFILTEITVERRSERSGTLRKWVHYESGTPAVRRIDISIFGEGKKESSCN